MSTSCRLTAVGYGDLVPRTSIGKVFCICVVIISTIYSAMPVSLVGSKFYELYEKHMEKMVVKRVRSRLNIGSLSIRLHTKLLYERALSLRVDRQRLGVARSEISRAN